MIYTMRDGSTVHDPRLGRLPEFDVRSRRYGVATLRPEVVNNQPPRNWLWECDTWLDQGDKGYCVGYTGAHELLAGPTVVPADNAKAELLYRTAQKHDQWEGEQYEGTSILGLGKAMRELGLTTEWWWCFGLRDLIMTVGYIAPVCIGINWYEGMSNPSVDGLIRPTGKLLGGHAMLVQGVNVDYQFAVIHNSWGQAWGHGGNCYILFADLEYLLMQQGEAAVMIDKVA